MALNSKQIRFCEEYLVDLNATQAAIRAGYSQKTAAVIAAENLIKPNIQAYIQERQKQLQQKTGITQERVLNEMARLAFVDHRKFFAEDGSLKQVFDLDDETAAALSGFEVMEETGSVGDGQKVLLGYTKKIKTYDKTKSLEMLARHLGMFEKDNDQQTKTITVNIV